MIKMIVFDIDGVLTDGNIIINSNGFEQKVVNMKDIDAIYELKRKGYLLAAITGEATEIVEYFRNRFPWDSFYMGKKNKVEVLIEISNLYGLSAKEICYIGDGKYDLEALSWVGLSICPADAIQEVKAIVDIILQNKGGHGCAWEIIDIVGLYNESDSQKYYFFSHLQEHTNLFKQMASNTLLMETAMEIARTMSECISEGKQIFLCGNGGSAADAQHIAAEFIGKFYHERPALNAEALTVNTSTLTALGNDFGYEQIFVRQLEAKAHIGDVVIGISTSGTSKNVIQALQYGHQNGLKTILMTGEQVRTDILEICNFILSVPSKITPRIQEAHIFLGHLIAEYVEYEIVNLTKNKIFKQNT